MFANVVIIFWSVFASCQHVRKIKDALEINNIGLVYN